MAIQDPLTEQIIGAAYRVAKSLGYGFLEKVYENALAHNYLKATRLPTCLLINFGKSGVELRRFGLDRAQDAPTPGAMAPEA